MVKKISKTLEDYREAVIERLSAVIPTLKSATLGNFTRKMKVPSKKDDFTELFITLNLLIESLQKATEKRKKVEGDITRHSLELNNIKQALLNVTDDLNKEKIKLEREKNKDEAILGSIGDGVVVTDSYGKITIMNVSAENMLNTKQAVGREFFDVWSLEDEAGQEVSGGNHPIQLALSSTGITTTTTFIVGLQYWCIRKDGTRFPVAITVSPVMLGKELIGAVYVFRDITKEKEIDRAKTEFVSLASHQLRTPLGIAKWYLEALKEQSYFKNAPETTLNYLNEIYKSIERLICLVNNLLSVSRIDQGQVKDNSQSTDVIKLIRDIVEEMRLVAISKNIKLILTTKLTSLSPVFVDPFQFREVLENLIANAIVYNVPSGSVEVIVTKKTVDSVLISVKDTGIGLSEEDQKKLFTKFFRSERAVSKNPDGSGLGLYVVKAYIEGWGGKVFVKSNEGKGATFTITVPLNIRGNRKGVAKN